MRQDRSKRIEFLLPNFSAGKGTYVVPWRSLPSLMTVTLHDRLLYEQLEGEAELTPESVRKVGFKVAQMGCAGPTAATAAKKALERESNYLTLTNFLLVIDLLKLVGVGADDLMKPGLSQAESKRLAREALNNVAGIVKVPADELSARMERLAAAVAPIGLAKAPEPGRVRLLLIRMVAFKDKMEKWAESDPSEVAQLGVFVAEIAGHTLALLRNRIRRFDEICVDLKSMVQNDGQARKLLGEQTIAGAWLLDGWDFLMLMWDSVADKPRETQQTTMGELFRFLPLIPKDEAVMAEDFDLESLFRVQRRWMRMNEDWRTGALDMPAVMRIEALKAELA